MIEIASRSIGPGQPCLVVAEAGVNHDGSVANALRLVDAAADAGADAVKFQTFRAEALLGADAPKAAYQKEHTDPQESQLDMLRRLELSFDDFREIHAQCRRRGILFLSTPFDAASVTFLAELGVPAFKVPSGEITNPAFLQLVARQSRPILLSTGMATLAEVDEAVSAIAAAGNDALVLLHCVSSYPAAANTINLRAMHTLAAAFGVPVGYSDHTLGIEIGLAAVALGACVLEKHLTLDRKLPGPDHQASLEPDEFAALVRGARIIESALGDGRKRPAPAERDTRQVARRSLVLSRDVSRGERIEPQMLTALRPGGGIAPKLGEYVVGRRSARDLKQGTVLAWQDLE